MKTVGIFRSAVFVLFAFVLSGFLRAEDIDFLQRKTSAGKASLSGDSYYVDFTIGEANFSPELKLPIQIFYDSAVRDEGIVGMGWRIPQLESSALPEKSGALWTTPWGEKVYFYSRKDVSKETLELFNERERENSYFSPFADWTANGRADSGSWTIYGRKDMKGWKFTYIDAKLRKIEAPSGRSINFRYLNGRLVSVEQKGVSFVELEYGKDRNLTAIYINGVKNSFCVMNSVVRILPETLAGKEEILEVPYLFKVWREGLNPVEFAYNDVGYLVEIRRGSYEENISVEVETLAQRRNYLRQVEAARKAKKSLNDVQRVATDGRILSDGEYKYGYPTNRAGCVRLTNKKGEVSEYSYDALRGISKVRDFAGREKSTYYFMRYDVAYNGKVRQVMDGRKRVLASYRYDKDTGKITRYRDKAKNDINFKYDKAGRLILISKRGANDNFAVPVRSFEYNKGSLKPSKINELDEKGGIVSSVVYQYDNALDTIYIGDGERSLKIGYNAFGYPIKVVDAFNIETNLEYDRYNRLINKNRNNVELRWEYDKNGGVKKAYSKFENEVVKSMEIFYDKNGSAVRYVDQDGIERSYGRDEYGRISKEEGPDKTEVKYTYDEMGNLNKVLDERGNEIKFLWGKNGLEEKRTAVGQITRNYYDEYGRLSKVDSKFEGKESDRELEYKYDEYDRVSEIKYGKGEVERFKYDTWGRMIERNKNGRFTYYKYDHFGRLVEKSEGGLLTKYAYDKHGRRILRSANRDKDVWNESNTYDKYGRLVKTEAGGKCVEYVYNKNNQLSEQILDGNRIQYFYTKLGWLESKFLFDKAGKQISELRYFYSPSGKITSRYANGKTQEYKYDAKDQLIAVIDGDSKLPVETYVYDESGNILRKTIKDETTVYTYDGANQLVSSVGPDGKEIKYGYDAAGRMIQEGEKVYEYGWLDKVIRVSENGKELSRFEYHNNGQIAKAVRFDAIERFEWDGLALVKRDDTKYINEPHAGGGNPVLAIDEGNSHAIFTDLLGTSMGSVSEKGYSAIDKTSFGSDSSDKTSFFTGKPYVEDLGYTFLFRNYRADIGKWQVRDLIGYPDGWNNFAYCNNSIITHVDLFGTVDLNLFPSNQAIHGYANKTPSFGDGNFTVGAHGNPSGIYGADGQYVPPSTLAGLMVDAGYQSGDTVWLLSCEVGQGSYGQELANILGATVMSFYDNILFSEDGNVRTEGNNGANVSLPE